MLTRRERERAEANRSALEELRLEIAPPLRSAGFRKSGSNTWRLDRPEIAVRFKIEMGNRSAGPWAAVDGTLNALVAASPVPAKPFRESIFDSQLELAGSDTLYQVGEDDDRSRFVADFLEHSLPWLLRYDSFAELWRALLRAELPGLMTAQRDARPKHYAQRALTVAHWDGLADELIEEAITYCWERGFTFDPARFDDEMADVVRHLPLTGRIGSDAPSP